MEKITVLVTGSKGYIGQHLCKMLSEYSNIEVYTIDIINDSELYYICADIRYNTLPKIKFDTVIHLAEIGRAHRLNSSHSQQSRMPSSA